MNSRLFAFGFFLPLVLVASQAKAESLSSLTERSQSAATVLREVVSISDHAIPKSLLEKSTCVATIPGVVRAGFIFGGRYGKGLVSCRVPGGWSKPSFVRVAGGSWGLQFGIETIDLVLVFTKSNAVEKFSQDNFTIGVDATVAAGPVGRNLQAGTDYQLNSEIYSYSRTQGLFAGLTIEGSMISVASRDNEKVYGVTAVSALLTADGSQAPAAVSAYRGALIEHAM